MLLCLVCLFDFAHFFLSHLSLKHVNIFYVHVVPLCAQSSSELRGHVVGHVVTCFPSAQAGCKPQKAF